MPMPGPAPKSDGQRRRRNALAVDWTDVVDLAFADGMKLPAKMPNDLPWPAWTKRWWAAVSTMPHCRLWAPSDWQFALDTAFLKALFHLSGDKSVATELRNREKVLGTTVDYRRALRIRYVAAPTTADRAEVTNLDEYRTL